jgi:hypothetical protein
MNQADLYWKILVAIWTVLVAMLSAGWAVFTLYRDRMSQSVKLTGEAMARLMDSDKLIIDNPEIQKYLSRTAEHDERYFHREAVLEDNIFFKAKAFAYRQLNSFDDILSTASKTSRLNSALNMPELFEISDWQNYFMVILRHPLYRSILNAEKDIFGESLRDFWKKHKKAIESTPVDRFIW